MAVHVTDLLEVYHNYVSKPRNTYQDLKVTHIINTIYNMYRHIHLYENKLIYVKNVHVYICTVCILQVYIYMEVNLKKIIHVYW